MLIGVSSHETSNDEGIAAVSLPRPNMKQSTVQCSHIFTFINVHGYLLMERLTLKLTIMTGRKLQCNMPDILSPRGEDCGADQYLGVEVLGIN
jgi:hypothetical protein